MSELLLSEVLGGMAEGVIFIGEDQRISLFNAASERIFGYTSEEILGQPIGILLPEKTRLSHKEKIVDIDKKTIESKFMIEQGEIKGQRKNGETFPAEATISMVNVDTKRVFVAILRDSSESKKTRDQLDDEKNKIYEAMMSFIHHILNNFLNQMLLFKETADETPGFDPMVLSLYEGVINDASKQIEALAKIDSVDETTISRCLIQPHLK